MAVPEHKKGHARNDVVSSGGFEISRQDIKIKINICLGQVRRVRQ